MLKRRRFIFTIIIFMIIFTSFGCFSMSYFIDMDADASGKGTIYHTFTVPNIGEKGASSFDSYVENLHQEGWDNIEIYIVGEDQIELSATYRLDHEAGRGFPQLLQGFKMTVEESENEYKYFTFDGNYDLTRLKEFWDGMNDPGSEVSVDLGKLLGGQKIEITREEIDSIIKKFGEPKVIYKVKLPGNTPIDAKGIWRNSSDYTNGLTDIIEFVWTPDKKPTGTLLVSRRWEPKVKLTQEEIKQNLEELLIKYHQEIPTGWDINLLGFLPTGGWFNNIVFAHFDKEAYTCGSYQNYVISFLDGIRTNPDPAIRNLLNGLDYGPIQTNGGGHVAVVVYPSDSDWRQAGTVLDPWPTQKPQFYDINTWFLNLGLYAYSGYSPEVTYGEETAYPHLSGKPSSYPATVDLSQKRAQPVRQILVINSPVTVVLKMEDGSLVGVKPDGSGINQVPWNVSFYALPKENGEHSWMFFLPDQTADVSIYGQNEGLVHMALVSKDKIMAYEPQQIQPGESFTFSIQPDAALPPLQMESGATVEPVLVNRDKFLELIGVAEPVESLPQPVLEENSFVPEPPYDENDSNVRIILFMFIGLCCCFVVILVVVVTILVLRRRQK